MASDMRVSSRLALKCDFFRFLPSSISFRRSVPCQNSVSKFKILRCVDAYWHGTDACRGNAHTRFQRPQLLQALTLFQRRWRQRNKLRKCRALIGINADMMVKRSWASWCGLPV